MGALDATPDSIHIKPRRLDLTFEGLETVFITGNPVKTALCCSLSAVFPIGERQFIKSVRHYENQVTDPVLRERIKGFIGQEAHHGNQHDIFNRKLVSLGWRVDLIERQSSFFNKLAVLFPPEQQLAQTVALEHLTALFADYLMKNPTLLGQNPHPDLKTLFMWHAVEETEHKSVAYDLFELMVGNDRVRKTEMRLVLPLFLTHMLESTALILMLNPNLKKRTGWHATWKEVFGKRGIFDSMKQDLNNYYDNSFHPWQHDNSKLATHWIGQLSI